MKTEESLSSKGFTLIEILVATVIFLFLTAIVVVNYQSANRRARDGRRQADLEQVRTALEIYRADNTTYPSGNWAAMSATLQTGKYLTTVPVDPRPSKYSYYYGELASAYTVCAHLETVVTSSCTIPGGSSCTEACNYCLCSP